MREINITFEENSWWICAGFLVIFFAVVFLAFRTYKIIQLAISDRRLLTSGQFGNQPPSRMMGAVRFQALLYLAVVIGGVWILSIYANEGFASFTRLERHGEQISFHYYFGWSREFPWRDVQSIVREPHGKHSSNIRFILSDGRQFRSISTEDEVALEDALLLRKDIQ